MSKRLGIFFSISLFSLWAHAQWSEKDSLNTGRILNTDGEIRLKQMIVDKKFALDVDVTLPNVFPDKKEIRLSLRPYSASTKYNYDPIYQKKIDIKSDTWKYGEKFRINGIINVAAGSWRPAAGGGISGDFMAVFTKDFWDSKGRKRKARTLEVLRNYGDSVTTLIKEDIKKVVIH